MRKLTRTEIFEKLPAHQAVMRQAMPAVASQMVSLIYSFADTVFVGMLNDPRQTAAVTIMISPFWMLTAIANLFGIGGASVISRYLGRKDTERSGQVGAFSFWFGLLTTAIFCITFTLLKAPILSLCGATEETYPYTSEYAKWLITFGGIPTVLNLMMSHMVAAEGNAILSSVGVSMGGILNILLDPIFVLPQFLNMGVSGAGLDTGLSNTAGALYFMGYLLFRRRKTVIKIRLGNLRYAGDHAKQVLSSGFPSAMQYALTVVALGAQSKFISAYSSEAVAAFGICKKIDQLPLYFSIGISNGLLPLLAYNYAAGNYKRMERIFRIGASVSLGVALVSVTVFQLIPGHLASLFIKDQVTIDLASQFLRLMCIAMPFMAICYPMTVKFQAIGHPKAALLMSVLRKGGLDIPLLYLFDTLLPLYGCTLVQPFVDTFSMFVALLINRRIKKEYAKIDMDASGK